MSESVLPMFSSRSFIVSGLTLRSLIHCIFLPPLSKIRCPYVRGFFSGLYIPDNELYFKNLCLNLNSGLLESPPHNLNHCVKLSF